jgi:hypothetical protein
MIGETDRVPQCTSCRSPAAWNDRLQRYVVRCVSCTELNNARVKMLQKARQDAGNCIWCGAPRAEGSKQYCAKHLAIRKSQR